MDSYRYAFNGIEGDSEFKGQGNSYTTEFRQYDARVGRWLSLDPLALKYAGISAYVAYGNNPILFEDKNGDSIRIAKAIFQSTMSALRVMASTDIGGKLYAHYQSNTKNHINIYGFTKNKNEKNTSWAETNSFSNVKIDSKGNVTVLNSNSKSNQEYINSSGFKFKKGDKDHFVGRNFTNDKHVKLDKYDLAFILFHEIQGHIKNRTGNPNIDHQNLGNKYFKAGMTLWYYDDWEEKNKTVVTYGTDSWSVFKQILEQKIKDGKGTQQNKTDLKYMNDYEKEQQ